MAITSISDILNYVPSHYNKLEKARFLYIELGKYSHYDPLFQYYSINGVYEYFNSVTSYSLPNITICSHLTSQYNYLLTSLGIKTYIEKTNIDELDGSYHPVLYFYDDDGKKHQTDLVHDLHRIQINSKTRYFAPTTLTDDERLALDENIGYISKDKPYSNDNWKKVQFILEKDSSLSPKDKFEFILKYAKVIYDFSQVGIYEQSTIYQKLFARLLPEEKKNINFSISKDDTDKKPVAYATYSNNDEHLFYLFDESSKTYSPTSLDVIQSLRKNATKPIKSYVKER